MSDQNGYGNTPNILGPSARTETIVTISVLTWLGVVGSVLNILVILYYIKKSNRGKTVPFLYTIMSVCNLVTCILAFIHGSVLMMDLHINMLHDVKKLELVAVGYVLYCLTSRSAIFQNLVLTVTRSINIMSVFFSVKWQQILPFLVVVYMVWFTIPVLDLMNMVPVNPVDTTEVEQWHELFTFPQPGEGSYWYFKNQKDSGETDDNTTYPDDYFNETPVLDIPDIPDIPDERKATLGLLVIGMVLPAVLMFITSVHQCYTITAQARRRRVFVQHQQQDSGRRLTITILCLSLNCLITNIIFTVFYVTYWLQDDAKRHEMLKEHHRLVKYYFSTVIHVINAVVEPTIFIIRGENIRTHIRRMLNRIDSRKSTKTNEVPLAKCG